jgi:hypothetical protein
MFTKCLKHLTREDDKDILPFAAIAEFGAGS